VAVVRVRIAAQELRFPEAEWEARVASGAVPPDALVFSLELTRGLWRRADALPLYDFHRRGGEEERREQGIEASDARPFRDLPEVVLPRRGLSGTELLLAVNLLVALVFMLLWREAYRENIFSLATVFRRLFVRDHVPVGFVATLFMHAGLQHLGANMITLLPAGGFVEYLYGRGRVLLIYLLGGIAGAIVSYLARSVGPMSVGASGAVYALIGAFAGFNLRHFRRMPRWNRWRAARIYIPLVVIATLPSIFGFDWRAHLGGFVGGLALGLALPLHERGRKLLMPSRPGGGSFLRSRKRGVRASEEGTSFGGEA